MSDLVCQVLIVAALVADQIDRARYRRRRRRRREEASSWKAEYQAKRAELLGKLSSLEDGE